MTGGEYRETRDELFDGTFLRNSVRAQFVIGLLAAMLVAGALKTSGSVRKTLLALAAVVAGATAWSVIATVVLAELRRVALRDLPDDREQRSSP